MNVIFILFLIGYAVGWFYVIKHAVLLLIPILRCRKIINCKKDDCPFRFYCKRATFSDAEKASIRKKIDSLNEEKSV